MTQPKENANSKGNGAGAIFAKGSQLNKSQLTEYFSDLPFAVQAVNDHLLYVHDSEYFAVSLNCMTLSIKQALQKPLLINGVLQAQPQNIAELINLLAILSVNIENEISGGLTWANIDQEIADLCVQWQIPLDLSLLRIALKSWFTLINFGNTRIDQSAYINLSIGALNSAEGALVCDAILDVLGEGVAGGMPYIFPNVQFRVKDAINSLPTAPYWPQYQQALAITAKQMNPTYILADSAMNQGYAVDDLHITGCRSRLLTSLVPGQESGLNRTNMGAVSINLPKLAEQADNEAALYPHLAQCAEAAVAILLRKSELIAPLFAQTMATVYQNQLLLPYTLDPHEIIKHASMSIGFIGGAEMAQRLLPHATLSEQQQLIERVLQYLRQCAEQLAQQHQRIVTLIGVSGEGLSYKFLQKEQAQTDNPSDIVKAQFEQGFYTNSFHVPVTKALPLTQKLKLEAPCHALCNGGGISYLEINHNPDNLQGLADVLRIASQAGANYVGFNFAKNLCHHCQRQSEHSEQCEHCGSEDLMQIRRVSGYLGYLSQFSHGKKLEEQKRVKHTGIGQLNTAQ